MAKEWEAAFEAKAGDEVIHTANERRLTELIGDVAGNARDGRETIRWRRTRVARRELIRLRGYLRTLIEVAVDAPSAVDVVMPGSRTCKRRGRRWWHWCSAAAAWQRTISDWAISSSA